MHPSSINNMEAAKNLWMKHLYNNDKIDILDVGGRTATAQNRDGSYKSIWEDISNNYWVADMKDGINVSHLVTQPYHMPLEDNSVDLIVSGQTLEHVPNPFRLINEFKRVLKPRCAMIIIVPSEGRDHDDFDYWRFKRDSFKAIASECELITLADWIDTRPHPDRSSQWRDHIYVGQVA